MHRASDGTTEDDGVSRLHEKRKPPRMASGAGATASDGGNKQRLHASACTRGPDLRRGATSGVSVVARNPARRNRRREDGKGKKKNNKKIKMMKKRKQ